MLRAAIGLAAIHFPEPTEHAAHAAKRSNVSYMLDGHLDAWIDWPELDEGDKDLITRLLAHRPNPIGNAEAVELFLDVCLSDGTLPGCSRDPDAPDEVIGVSPGMPLRQYVEEALAALDFLRRKNARVRKTAEPGRYHTALRLPDGDGGTRKVATVHYLLADHHTAADVPPLPLATQGPATHVDIDVNRCRVLAGKADAALGTPGYYSDNVDRLLGNLHHATGRVGTSWRLTAGHTELLNAPTGIGKTVGIQPVMASLVEAGYSTGLLMPTNKEVLQLTYQLHKLFAALNIDADVVPLMSPASMMKELERAAGGSTGGPPREWLLEQLGYGCALAATASTDEQIDAWKIGEEPCTRLSTLSEPHETFACPWRATCGRFSLARRALTAKVIITSHANYQDGLIHVPVDNGSEITDRSSVEALFAKRIQALFIDEIDDFQATAIDRAGRGLRLDQRGDTNTPLRRFDTEFGAANHAVHPDVDAEVHDAVALARYLSGSYVGHLAHGRLAPDTVTKGRPGPRRRWTIPQRWDAWLMARIFTIPTGTDVPSKLRPMFESLFPNRAATAQPPVPGEPAAFQAIRTALRRVCQPGTGAQAVSGARWDITTELETIVACDAHRGVTVDPIHSAGACSGCYTCEPCRDCAKDLSDVATRMIRRAMLNLLRGQLHKLLPHLPQLHAVGVPSTREIADALMPFRTWRAAPTGPLGRLVFAFHEHLDDTGSSPVSLSTAGFGGDPHVYTLALGDVTARCHTGRARIVTGLSATGFFHGAPRHHLHRSPTWWIPDNNPGSVTIEAVKVTIDQDLVTVSGRSGTARTEALRDLSAGLWRKHLGKKLQILAITEPDRARALLATTSYDSCVHIAEGLIKAGVDPQRICVAARPHADLDEAWFTGRWWQIPADRLADFPSIQTADILIAPLARVQRGVNIIGAGNRSALGAIYLMIRPVPLIDEPAELLAHIQSTALALHPAGIYPVDVLTARRKTAGLTFEEIASKPPYFHTLPAEVRRGVIAEIINGAIQLVGRARRGGTSATLYLVDGAFHGDGIGFAPLTRDLEAAWAKQPGVLPRMQALYGTTLQAFIDFARTH